MLRMPRMLRRMAAVAAVAVSAWSGGANAYPDASSTYIYVSKQLPERLYLIDGGKVIFESPVNTGIHVAQTPEGAFRIFASYLKRDMKGTDPVTLRRYNDRNVPYAMYYDGGRAIHGFHRSGYGYPQSFGCIELPVSKARQLYALLQGGLETEVVVARRRPSLETEVAVARRRPVEHGRADSNPGSARPAALGSEGQGASHEGASDQGGPYPIDVGVAAETLQPP